MAQFGVDFSAGFNMTSMIVLIVFAATVLTIFALALPFMRGERFEPILGLDILAVPCSRRDVY